MRNIFLFLFICCTAVAFAQPGASPASGNQIRWMEFDQATKQSAQEPRLIFISLYVELDEFCKLMNENVFTDPRVVEMLNNEFYAVKFNGQEPKTILFNGKYFSNMNDEHKISKLTIPLLSSTNITFPAFAFFDENGKMLTVMNGYQSAENLLEILSFIKKQYRRVNWDAHAIFPQAFGAWADKEEPQPATQEQPAQTPVQTQQAPAQTQTPTQTQPAQQHPPKTTATNATATPSTTNDKVPVSAGASTMTGVIKWYSIEEADKLCAQAPRKFFIDVYTDWCGWCKKMDKETFTDPTIANYINENFYPVKLNAESKEPIVFNNNTYSSQQRTHDLAIALLQGQLSYPSFVILDRSRQAIGILKGYLEIEQLYQTLVFVGDNYYITSNNKDFQDQWPRIKEETDKKYKPKR